MTHLQTKAYTDLVGMLEFKDAPMFGRVMRNEELCKQVLEVILNRLSIVYNGISFPKGSCVEMKMM